MAKYSKSSITRIITAFKGMDNNKISEIQTAYRNKDYNHLRVLFNKPNLSDSSIGAQARLANQYHSQIIYNPKPATIAIVKSRYGVVLTTNFQTNLALMGNVGRNIPPIPLKFPDCLRLDSSYQLRNMRKFWETIATFYVDTDVNKFLARVKAIDPVFIKFIRANGISEFRFYLKIKTSIGDSWVSTQRIPIYAHPNELEALNQQMDVIILNKIKYEVSDIFVDIKGYLEGRIRWY